jgi:hypothetical protein
MTFYQVPGEPHPIDEARALFLDAALCDTETAGARAGAGTARWLLLTPDVSLPLARRR